MGNDIYELNRFIKKLNDFNIQYKFDHDKKFTLIILEDLNLGEIYNENETINLTQLDSIIINGNLTIKNLKIINLPKIIITNVTYFFNNNIINFPEISSGSDIYFQDNIIKNWNSENKSFLKGLWGGENFSIENLDTKIIGKLNVRNLRIIDSNIESLSENIVIRENLYIKNCPNLKEIPKNIEINGILYCEENIKIPNNVNYPVEIINN
jgi:hypothetical protein